MKRRTLYVILGFLTVAVTVGVVVWRSRAAGQTEEVIRSAVVERGSMLVAVSASGSIEPEARVGLTFEAPGRVTEVLVEEGDRVEAGDALARLDAGQLELQVEQSKAALALAEAQLAQIRSGPRPQEIEQAEADLRAAEAQLSAATAGRDQLSRGPADAEIAAAEAQVAQAWTRKEIAQDTYDLIDDAKEEEKEHANYDLYTAKQELAAAQARLDDLLAGVDADELRAAEANVSAAVAQRDAAQAQLNRLLAGPTEEEVAEAEAQVAQAHAALELAALSLEEATLRAPFDGVVSEVNVTRGELPPTRVAPILLLDNSTFHMTISVDELDVGQLAEGQTARVTVDALPETAISGTIKRIAPVASLESGVVTYDVVIELDAADAPIRSDMTASATIAVRELTDVLKVPTWVVRVDRDTGQTYVHRRVVGDRPGQLERVDVELGVRHEGIAQVLGGLSEGDEVVRTEDSDSFDFGSQ